VFKTSWKQLEQEMPTVFISYKDVESMLEALGHSNAGDWDLYEEALEKLKELAIYVESPVAKHRSPSYGSD